MASRAIFAIAIVEVLAAAGRAPAQESDDVFILDMGIPAPGPFACGPDPTRDDFSCRTPSCG